MALATLHAVDGGPPRAVLQLATALQAAGDQVTIVAFQIPGFELDAALIAAEDAGVQVEFVPVRRLGKFRFSVRYLSTFLRAATTADKIVSHGFYQWPSVVAFIASKRIGPPLILQPHGVFEPYQEAQGSSLKKQYMAVIGKQIIRSAECLVATSDLEIDGFRHTLSGLNYETVMVPLGVERSEFDTESLLQRYRSNRVLYLSRIAPKKRLDLLIRAVEVIAARGIAVHLTICGTGDPVYVNQLRAITQDATQVTWAGHVSGTKRHEIEQDHAIFCLPTENENFGQAIVEAMAVGLPVVTTSSAGASTFVRAADCGWVLEDITVEVLANTIIQALQDPGSLAAMGARGAHFCADNLTWSTVATEWRRIGPSDVGGQDE